VRHNDRYMTSRQAAAALGVSVATLYSYVSRGMLRSDRVAGRPRVRRYLKEDVARLIERKDFRKNPAKAATQGLHWGSPVLESALTLIDEGRLFYRGVDAIELAQRATVEEVAALLWTGDSSQAGNLFTKKSVELPPRIRALFDRAPRLGPIERCQLVLPVAAAADLSAYDLRPAVVARTGARILRLLFSAACGASAPGSIDTALTRTLTSSRRSAAPALRAALILCADHELNVSAFTARCIASARTTPYEVVMGALAAFSGLRHGGASEEIESLFREAEKTRQRREILAKRLRSFGALPGFGHRLYPGGDPRARLLISLARMHGRGSAVELSNSLILAARALTGEYPNLDFGLVTLARTLDLPSESPIALFALGRTVGWIAHAIEQYADDQLIRPRARYIGPIPSMPERGTPDV
jgi:citrate synthase